MIIQYILGIVIIYTTISSFFSISEFYISSNIKEYISYIKIILIIIYFGYFIKLIKSNKNNKISSKILYLINLLTIHLLYFIPFILIITPVFTNSVTSYEIGRITLFEHTILILNFLYIFKILITYKNNLKINIQKFDLIIILLITLGCIVNIFYSINVRNSFVSIRYFLSLLVFYIMLKNNKIKTKVLLNIIIFVVTLVLIYSLKQIIIGDPIYTFYNLKNTTASIVLYSSAIILYYIYCKPNIYKKLLLYIIEITIIFVIFQSKTQSVMLSIIIGSYVYINLIIFDRYKKFTYIIFLNIIFGLVVYKIINFNEIISQNYDRLLIWLKCIEISKHFNYLGIGINNIDQIFNFYTDINIIRKIGYNTKLIYVHNDYLQIFLDTGIFGTLLYLGILGSIVNYSKKLNCKIKKIYIFFITLFFVNSFFIFNIYNPAISLNLIIILYLFSKETINRGNIIGTKLKKIVMLFILVGYFLLIHYPFNYKNKLYSDISYTIWKKFQNVNDLKKSIELEPYKSFKIYYLANYFFNQKKYNQALTLYEKCFEINQKNIDAEFNIIKCKYLLGLNKNSYRTSLLNFLAMFNKIV